MCIRDRLCSDQGLISIPIKGWLLIGSHDDQSQALNLTSLFVLVTTDISMEKSSLSNVSFTFPLVDCSALLSKFVEFQSQVKKKVVQLYKKGTVLLYLTLCSTRGGHFDPTDFLKATAL